ncbi:hypothetical protein, partial [Bradyrhizobium sp. Leo170]|uniref:hypothetical protein n=1 Tax=Bradyrhizobium sp. Leo170 TaxID=1571199 RepID=UPI00102E6739
MRSEGWTAPIVAKTNADGRYAEFLITAPDQMALIPRTISVEALSAFVEAIESRIEKGDFHGRFDSLVPGDRRDLFTVPRHLVVALKEGKAQQAFFSWCPPETGQTIKHGTGRVVQSFGLSSFDIRIESNAGYYRFKLTATDRRTAQFAFSYGIERSPFLTCIMHVRAG